jgi:uncharacterized protein
VLGWTVGGDGNPTYQTFTTGDPDGVHGGLFATDGELASYAVFSVIVEDVAATCRKAEEAGGKVQRAPRVNPDGLTFAHLRLIQAIRADNSKKRYSAAYTLQPCGPPGRI